jgi:glycosyltransferase involved in cell wall biosynthesis
MDRLASVILPCHNQADHLGEVVARYIAATADLPLRVEFVLVPNSCRDDTPQVCRALAERHDHVRVVEVGEPGWGRAVRAGLEQARGDLLCYTNSARTSTEMLVLSLLFASVHANAVIKANRRIRDNILRRLGSLLYNLECRMLFDLPEWDINGTPKVFPRSASTLLALERDDDLIDLEFVVRCRRGGHPILEVPLLATERHGGESTTSLGSAVRMYVGALRLARAWGRP